MIRALALDPSLTATGYAHLNHDSQPTTGIIATGQLRGPARLAHIAATITRLTTDTGADLIAIEGYAYSRPNQSHQIGELGGVIRTTLWGRKTPYIDVPPATVKKYATGKGNADKQAVLAAAIRRLNYDGHDHNEADALWILAAIYDAAGHPICDMPQSHRDALTPIKSALDNHDRTPA